MSNFGVEWGPFLASIATFGLVLFILQRFAFAPIIKVLEERRRIIAEGQANAARIKTQLAESERKTQEMLDKANAQAQTMINDARTSSDALAARRAEEASAEAKRIMDRAHEANVQEHDRVLNDVKRELGRLVIETTSRVTGKILNSDDRNRLNEETSRQIS